jgi:hypothetical protein
MFVGCRHIVSLALLIRSAVAVVVGPSLTRDPIYLRIMQLHGPLIDNLENALVSARRLRGHPVYKDTLSYWAELVQEARRARQEPECPHFSELGVAIAKLETELADYPK